MNRKEAEKLADKIFDMIDRNYPRGLIKSDLVDLIAGFRWDDDDTWKPIGEAIDPALSDILREQRALQEIRQLFANDPCGND